MSICKYYGEEFDCCKLLSDFSNPMTELRPCEQEGCEYYRPITNYDKITETAESLAEFIIFVVNESKNQRRLVSKILKDKNGKNELKKTIKEWLQKECEDGNT
jgi:hypothetical protein